MSHDFVKMHGLGNDFVIVETTDHFTADYVRTVSSRRLGIGCDQFIVLRPAPDETADVVMEIYNPDGSRAEACGNATRCVADIICTRSGRDFAKIRTEFGLLTARRSGGLYTVDMGVPRLDWAHIPLAHEMDTLFLQADFPVEAVPCAVSMGNPHCVFFVAEVPDDEALTLWGRVVEHHSLFPRRTNVEFAVIEGPTRIRMRVWERGAGITPACGSAACATLVAAVRRGLTERAADLVLDGGTLHIVWPDGVSGVQMTGPVARVFAGTLP